MGFALYNVRHKGAELGLMIGDGVCTVYTISEIRVQSWDLGLGVVQCQARECNVGIIKF